MLDNWLPSVRPMRQDNSSPGTGAEYRDVEAGADDSGFDLERRSAFHQSVALHLCCSGDRGRGRAQHETTFADFDLGVWIGDLEVRQNGADGSRQIARLRVFTADLVL